MGIQAHAISYLEILTEKLNTLEAEAEVCEV